MNDYNKQKLKDLQERIDTCDYNDNYNLINIMGDMLDLLRSVIYELDDKENKKTTKNK